MQSGYIKSLDGIRAFAILLVMTFHFGITHFGWIGVQLFFVLSGFLISSILWKEKQTESTAGSKLKKFWARRSLRIFPLYFGFLFFVTVSYFVFHFPSYYGTYIPYLATYTVNFTRTFSNWHTNPLFTHLWSLSVEEQFYLFFPLIVYLTPVKFIRIFMAGVVVISPIVRFILGEYYKSKGYVPAVVADTIYWNTLSHLDAFFMGGIIPVFSVHKKVKDLKPLVLLAVLLVIGAGIWNYYAGRNLFPYLSDLGYSHGRTEHYEYVWHYSLLNLFFSLFILLLINAGNDPGVNKLKKFFEKDWLVKIGKVSYGMYVFHWAFIVYVVDRILFTENVFLKILLFIPYTYIVYLFSSISFRYYESWFISLKDKYFGGGKVKAGITKL